MGEFEIFLSNFCSPHPIKAFTIGVHKPVGKRRQDAQFYSQPEPPKKKKIKKIEKKLWK